MTNNSSWLIDKRKYWQLVFFISASGREMLLVRWGRPTLTNSPTPMVLKISNEYFHTLAVRQFF